VIGVIVLAANLFLQTFAGTWQCGGTSWHIDAAKDSQWSVVSWGSGRTGGTAYVGYVPQIQYNSSSHGLLKGTWVYDDFHADGAYGISVSRGIVDGQWTWTGSFFPANAAPDIQGQAIWKKSSPTRIDRTFKMVDGKTVRVTGSDYCTKS
jgi:hypothetical protein